MRDDMRDLDNPDRCPACDCAEGDLHDDFCQFEDCPFCGGQLVTCDCMAKLLDIFDGEPTKAYSEGCSDADHDLWRQMLAVRGRRPYIRYAQPCGRCGKRDPEFFSVSEEEWAYYIAPYNQKDIICRECYEYIAAVTDRAAEKRGCPAHKAFKARLEYEGIEPGPKHISFYNKRKK